MATEFIERRNSRAPFATKGFTIVELVVVVILLGILAATALPRFIDIDTEAQAAVVDGVGGGLQTGGALFYYTAENNSSGLDVPVLTYDSMSGSVIQSIVTLA